MRIAAVRAVSVVVVVVVVALAGAPAADAAVQEKVLRYGPVEMAPYEVHREEVTYDVPSPEVDGWMTAIRANVVDARGRPVPIARTMLHHIVLANAGSRVGERRDATCDRFRLFDGETQLPALGERFYGAGEERARLDLPEGYGYRLRAGDRWAMSLMLMNHRNRTDRVWVEYRVKIETGRDLRPVTPWWLDVKNCMLDPIYDVPGDRRRGSTHVQRSAEFVAPESGRLVFGGAHLHGGGKGLVLRSASCADRVLFDSRPLWGRSTHPFYRVRPVLHEPGPIAMEHFSSGAGIPVAKGERLRLDSLYDGELPHVRAMGIMVVAFAPDPTVPEGCASLPPDVREYWTASGGRTRTPRTTIPLNHLPISRLGRGTPAREVDRPPGPVVARPRGGAVDVGDLFFDPPNLVVRRGATVRWRFTGSTLHNVTLASGPQGFSSFDLNDERTYARRLTRPGTYRLFCGLHPTSMLQSVRVTR